MLLYGSFSGAPVVLIAVQAVISQGAVHICTIPNIFDLTWFQHKIFAFPPSKTLIKERPVCLEKCIERSLFHRAPARKAGKKSATLESDALRLGQELLRY